jgi:hypothetical protein
MAIALFILWTAITVSGGHGEEETPVPIPNTEVKLLCADGTALETGWESRSPPGFISKPLRSGGAFFWEFRFEI